MHYEENGIYNLKMAPKYTDRNKYENKIKMVLRKNTNYQNWVITTTKMNFRKYLKIIPTVKGKH